MHQHWCIHKIWKIYGWWQKWKRISNGSTEFTTSRVAPGGGCDRPSIIGTFLSLIDKKETALSKSPSVLNNRRRTNWREDMWFIRLSPCLFVLIFAIVQCSVWITWFIAVVNICLQMIFSIIFSYMIKLDKSNDHGRKSISDFLCQRFVLHIKCSWNLTMVCK